MIIKYKGNSKYEFSYILCHKTDGFQHTQEGYIKQIKLVDMEFFMLLYIKKHSKNNDLCNQKNSKLFITCFDKVKIFC